MPTYILKGQVTDASTGSPLFNIMVKIIGGPDFGLTTFTDAHGKYLMMVQAGRLIIEVGGTSACYQIASQSPTIVTNTVLDFALAPWFTISGRVADALTGTSLPNMTVRLSAGSRNMGKGAVTGSNGRYSIACIVAEPIIVEAWGNGYQLASQGRNPIAGNTVMNFALMPTTFTISGKVTHAGTGRPLRGAMVKQLGPIFQTVFTDRRGRYQITGVAPGMTIVEASDSPCYLFKSWGGSIATNQTVDFALKPAHRLTGRVTDATTGAALAQALVRVVGGTNIGRTTLSGSNGRYELMCMQPGPTVIEASSAGHQAQSSAVTLAGNAVLNFSLS